MDGTPARDARLTATVRGVTDLVVALAGLAASPVVVGSGLPHNRAQLVRYAIERGLSEEK